MTMGESWSDLPMHGNATFDFEGKRYVIRRGSGRAWYVFSSNDKALVFIVKAGAEYWAGLTGWEMNIPDNVHTTFRMIIKGESE